VVDTTVILDFQPKNAGSELTLTHENFVQQEAMESIRKTGMDVDERSEQDGREDAWYHYVVPQGVVGNQQPVIHASKISRPILRHDPHSTVLVGERAAREQPEVPEPVPGPGPVAARRSVGK